jgi:hypothetical protein
MRFIPAREGIDVHLTFTTQPNHDNLQWVGVEQIRPSEALVIDRNRDPRAASMGVRLVN